MTEEKGNYDVTPKPGVIRRSCFKDYSAGYTPPIGAEVREMMRRIGMSGSQVANHVGASSPRTVRKWCADPQHLEHGSKNAATIPYACWRLLCLVLIEKKSGIQYPNVAEEMATYAE